MNDIIRSTNPTAATEQNVWPFGVPPEDKVAASSGLFLMEDYDWSESKTKAAAWQQVESERMGHLRRYRKGLQNYYYEWAWSGWQNVPSYGWVNGEKKIIGWDVQGTWYKYARGNDAGHDYDENAAKPSTRLHEASLDTTIHSPVTTKIQGF